MFEVCSRSNSSERHAKPKSDEESETFTEQDLKDMMSLVLENYKSFSELNEILEIGEEDSSCRKVPDFGFHESLISRFHQNHRFFCHHDYVVYNMSGTIFTFQLLYEAQNVLYCQDYAKYQFRTPSLCLYNENLSPFDMLCVSYFLQNSNKAWNHLHISDIMPIGSNPTYLKVFANSLTNNSTQQNSSCNILEIAFDLGSTQTKIFSSSFLCNITECYCVDIHFFCRL